MGGPFFAWTGLYGGHPQLAAEGDTLFVSDGGITDALRMPAGERRWTAAVGGTPVPWGDVLLVTKDDATSPSRQVSTAALDGPSGRILWPETSSVSVRVRSAVASRGPNASPDLCLVWGPGLVLRLVERRTGTTRERVSFLESDWILGAALAHGALFVVLHRDNAVTLQRYALPEAVLAGSLAPASAFGTDPTLPLFTETGLFWSDGREVGFHEARSLEPLHRFAVARVENGSLAACGPAAFAVGEDREGFGLFRLDAGDGSKRTVLRDNGLRVRVLGPHLLVESASRPPGLYDPVTLRRLRDLPGLNVFRLSGQGANLHAHPSTLVWIDPDGDYAPPAKPSPSPRKKKSDPPPAKLPDGRSVLGWSPDGKALLLWSNKHALRTWVPGKRESAPIATLDLPPWSELLGWNVAADRLLLRIHKVPGALPPIRKGMSTLELGEAVIARYLKQAGAPAYFVAFDGRGVERLRLQAPCQEGWMPRGGREPVLRDAEGGWWSTDPACDPILLPKGKVLRVDVLPEDPRPVVALAGDSRALRGVFRLDFRTGGVETLAQGDLDTVLLFGPNGGPAHRAEGSVATQNWPILRDADGRDVLHAFEGPSVIAPPELSPAGDRAAVLFRNTYDSKMSAGILDLATGAWSTPPVGVPKGVARLGWSPDGTRLAAWGGESVAVLDVG